MERRLSVGVNKLLEMQSFYKSVYFDIFSMSFRNERDRGSASNQNNGLYFTLIVFLEQPINHGSSFIHNVLDKSIQ